jgi:hypothetical protein
MPRERHSRVLHPALRALAALSLLMGALLTATPAAAASTTLNVRLYLTPANAARGDVVAYEILVENTGGARADRVRVRLPFSEHMKVVRTDFSAGTTWISELKEAELTVMFGRVNRGEERRARLFFEIGPNAPDGLQVRVRASGRYEGDDARYHSTYVTLTVGGQEDAPEPQVTVEPSATAPGGRLVFQVRNYFPREQVFTWINAPDGRVLETGLSGQVSAAGETNLSFDTRKLQPGAYTMVVFGKSSEITTVVPFTIQ